MNQVKHKVLSDILELMTRSHSGKQGVVTVAYARLLKLQLISLVKGGFHHKEVIRLINGCTTGVDAASNCHAHQIQMLIKLSEIFLSMQKSVRNLCRLNLSIGPM